jgi:integrase/recombinase XerD
MGASRVYPPGNAGPRISQTAQIRNEHGESLVRSSGAWRRSFARALDGPLKGPVALAMLRIYRRHRALCPHRSERYRRCACPIYVEGTLGGEAVRKSLDLTSWQAASELVTKWTDSGQVGVVRLEIPSIRDAIAKFFEDATARGLQESSLQKLRRVLEHRLQPWCDDRGYRHLKQLDVDALRQFRATWPDAPISAAKNLERLRSFFRFCHVAQWLPTNPVLGVKPPRVIQTPTLPFTEEEMVRIVAACDKYPERNAFGHDNRARVRAFVLTLRYSGLRIRDCATLPVSRLNGSKLFLYQAKTGTPVCVPIPPCVVTALSETAQGRYFFWTGNGLPKSAVADWQRSLRRVFALADVVHGHAHRFRDTFAVELLLKGVPIDQVATLLGHTSVRVTEKHYSPWVKARQDQLEAAVRLAWA